MSEQMRPSFAVADWGTSSFRLWLVSLEGAILGERRSAEGLMRAREIGFSAVLEGHLLALDVASDLPAVLCGMVGARTGWVEADYLDAPVALADIPARASRVPEAGRPVFVLPGVAQRDPAAPDVMRGEETKLLGLGIDADGLVVMPGTHTKWAMLEGGRLAGFATAMTGEIFAHMREAPSSVLRDLLAGAAPVQADSPAFEGGLREGLDAPETLLSALFRLRAAALLLGTGGDALLARCSGLLIGAELAGMRRRFGALDRATLVGAGPSAALYRSALSQAGCRTLREVDADEAVRAGLVVAARSILQTHMAGAA